MNNSPLSTKVILQKFVPVTHHTPEIYRQVDLAVRSGDVDKLAYLIQQTQAGVMVQQRQIDTLAQKVDALVDLAEHAVNSSPVTYYSHYDIEVSNTTNNTFNYTDARSYQSWDYYNYQTWDYNDYSDRSFTGSTYQEAPQSARQTSDAPSGSGILKMPWWFWFVGTVLIAGLLSPCNQLPRQNQSPSFAGDRLQMEEAY